MLMITSKPEIEAMIQPNWRVLDVGSGDRPFPPATMLVDRLPRSIVTEHGKHTENPKGTIQRYGKPFVEGDLEALPFADGAFDFVHASHVLEHVVSAKKAIAELERVAPRGYIECPRAWFEMVDGSPFHNWLIDLADGELQLRPKPPVVNEFIRSRRLFDLDRALFVQIYGGVFEPTGHREPVRLFEKQLCNVCVYWERNIPYRILPPSQFQNHQSNAGEERSS